VATLDWVFTAKLDRISRSYLSRNDDQEIVLQELNRDFFDQHWHEHIPAVSLHADVDTPGVAPLLLSGQREGTLQQTMEFITGTETGPIWIIAGRLSWLREVQLALVLAALRKIEIKILCSVPSNDPEDFDGLAPIASASGCSVAVAREQFATRFTFVNPLTKNAALIAVEKLPALHALILKSPHEAGLLNATAQFFDQSWSHAVKYIESDQPCWEPLDKSRIIDLLRNGVPSYRNADLDFETVDPETLRPLPKALERLKLSRLHILEVLFRDFKVPLYARLRNSPWPIVAPIAERQSDGTLVVIDGAHRIYSALERGELSIEVIVVKRATMPLPATPQPNWNDVKVLTPKVPRADRYINFDESFFRPIRDALRQS
jgi:hypothetical protein